MEQLQEQWAGAVGSTLQRRGACRASGSKRERLLSEGIRRGTQTSVTASWGGQHMVACSAAEWGVEMVEIEAWCLSPAKYLSPCAIPTPKEAWAICLVVPAGPGVSDSKEPRCWASEHLQTLECARPSFLEPPHSQQPGGALKVPGLQERETQEVSRVSSQGSQMVRNREGAPGRRSRREKMGRGQEGVGGGRDSGAG